MRATDSITSMLFAALDEILQSLRQAGASDPLYYWLRGGAKSFLYFGQKFSAFDDGKPHLYNYLGTEMKSESTYGPSGPEVE
jgi:hypothetical protein